MIQSTRVPAATVGLAVYQEVVIGMFGGTDLVIDPHTQARAATVLITQHQMADIGVRHAEAFCDISLTA